MATTLYYDAEEGTLRTENGEELEFDMSTEDDETQEDEADDGAATPTLPAAAADTSQNAAATQQAPQTITSETPNQTQPSVSAVPPVSAGPRRPGRLRRLSSATQQRVGHSCKGGADWYGSNTTADPAATRTRWFTVCLNRRDMKLGVLADGIRNIFSQGVTTRSAARAAGARHAQLADDDEEEGEYQISSRFESYPDKTQYYVVSVLTDSFADEAEEDEEEEAYLGYGAGRRSRRSRRTVVGDRYPKIPSEEGMKLMDSGTFGTNDRCDHRSCGEPLDPSSQRKRRKLARRMLDREMGADLGGRRRALNALASQTLIPSSKADVIINMNARCYSGQFSEDGNFFFAAGQDFKVRMYDTSNPYDWRYYKTVNYYGGQWTITDASLSPDNKYLAYSSIRSQVCLAPTDPENNADPTLLDFSDMGSGGQGHAGGGGWGRSRGHFGIWSLRYSGDGTEIVAGTSDQSVYVYDLESRRSILRIPAHNDDVNAVCFGDKMSPHILYSGSDDTTLKVWDRRSLSSLRPAGMFLGHTEGLTYIDSKGDGRYVISNAKDQTCKLWDLRHMISTDVGERINPQDYTTNFDYRFSPYDTEEHIPHPHDCSLVTFRGHRVLKTLIRCHFSPQSSTDGRYIYSGSHDGRVYVWNLDGTTAGSINVLAATKNSRPQSDERYVDRYDYYGRGGVWKTIVRDCSWHPHAPVIAATSWNGWDHGLGTCTVHSWNDGAGSDELTPEDEDPQAYAKADSLGSAPMGARVTAQLEHDDRYYGKRTRPSLCVAR